MSLPQGPLNRAAPDPGEGSEMIKMEPAIAPLRDLGGDHCHDGLLAGREPGGQGPVVVGLRRPRSGGAQGKRVSVALIRHTALWAP